MENKQILVNANELLDEFLRRYTEREKNGQLSFVACEIKQDFADMISEATPVDAVEVVHGRWLEDAIERKGDFPLHMYECSECGGIVYHHKFNYCPKCGAKMDVTED